MAKFRFTALNPMFNKQCVFFSLFIYAKSLIKPTDLPELCLLKPRDLPKTENRVVTEKSTVYSSPCSRALNV